MASATPRTPTAQAPQLSAPPREGLGSGQVHQGERYSPVPSCHRYSPTLSTRLVHAPGMADDYAPSAWLQSELVCRFEQAVEANDPERAYKLAACLSYPVPGATQELMTAELDTLKQGYQKLVSQAQPGKNSPGLNIPPSNIPLFEALTNTLVSTLCTSASRRQQNQHALMEACTGTLTPFIDQTLTQLEQLLRDGSFDQAREKLNNIFYPFRLLLNPRQKQRLGAVFQKLTPVLLQQAELKPTPEAAIGFLCREFFPLTELLAIDDQQQQALAVKESTGRRIRHWLETSLLSEQGKPLTASRALYLNTLVHFLSKHQVLTRMDTDQFNLLLRKHTPKTKLQPGNTPAGEKLAGEVAKHPLQGNSYKALALCLRNYSQHPKCWHGARAITLNHRLKCALRAELIQLCCSAARSKELSLVHCQQLNKILSLLRQDGTAAKDLLQQPWIIGQMNISMLFTLRYLFSSWVLQPRWNNAMARPASEQTVQMLDDLLQNFTELLSDQHKQQLSDKRRELEQSSPSRHSGSDKALSETNVPEDIPSKTPTPVSQPVETVPTVPAGKPESPPKTIAPEASLTASAADTAKPKFSLPAPGTKVTHPRVTMARLKAILASEKEVKRYVAELDNAGDDQLHQACAWVDLLQQYYRDKPFPRSSFPSSYPKLQTLQKYALACITSALLKVLTKYSHLQIMACGEDPEKKSVTGRRLADYFAAHFYPLGELAHVYDKQSYLSLSQALYKIYLEPLSDAALQSQMTPTKQGTQEDLWQHLDRLYPHLMLYRTGTMQLLQGVYTRFFRQNIEDAKQNLATNDNQVFRTAVEQVITLVLDKANFFSLEKTAPACHLAEGTVKAALRALKRRYTTDSKQWQPLLERFQQKYAQARFLHLSEGEPEYFPPDRFKIRY